MDANVCIICKQPILGYWHELGKNKIICQSCAAVTTVYDLFQRGIIDIKPDIVETEAVVYQDSEPLVTKGDDEKNPPDRLPYETLSEVCKRIGITRDELVWEVNTKAREYEGDNVDLSPEERDTYFGYACADVAEVHGVSPNIIVDIYNGVTNIAVSD